MECKPFSDEAVPPLDTIDVNTLTERPHGDSTWQRPLGHSACKERTREVNVRDVGSEAFSSYDYDAETQELIINFQRGNPYRYRQVPDWEIENMEKAESMGRYFNENIRNRYDFDEVL